MTNQHQRTITSEFAKQAQGFGQKGLTLSSDELLAWAVDNLPLDSVADALDIAAGTAHLARAMAPHVATVIGIDATPEMLAKGIDAAREAGIHNLRFVRGLAEALPFVDETFDLTVCRLAIHHYQEPSRHAAEMARACRSGGAVAIVDLVAPDDADLASRYNHFERLRDPSHTEALSVDDLAALLEVAGVAVDNVNSRLVTVAIEPWLALTHMPQEPAEMIRRALRAELDGGPATGMRPFVEGETLKFVQTWVVVSGQKR